jgi:hypothetical protein
MYADASDPTQFFGLLANQSADVTPSDQVEWERLQGPQAPSGAQSGKRNEAAISLIFCVSMSTVFVS